MLDCTLGIGRRGWDITTGYETLAPQVPLEALPRRVRLERICVEPAQDVAAQMEAIARTPVDASLAALTKEHFSIVHGHFGPRLLQAAAFAQRGVPVIISLYGYDVGRLLRDSAWVERYKWGAANGVIFVALARRMFGRLEALGMPGHSLRLITLGVRLEAHHFNPKPAPRPARFVFIGRFVEKKGVEHLLRAMALIEPAASLDLVGGGELEPALRELAASLGISSRVCFIGRVPFDRLFDQLDGATALVQPSVTAADGDAEGAPMVLMHAQAAGTPCITTDHSGNPETLPPPAAGFVVPEGDASALAGAMETMIALAPARRAQLQRAGRAWIEERYDLNKTLSAYDALYHQLASSLA